jgi:hypothetical protein
MSNFAIDAADYFDADFFDQFDRRHVAPGSAGDPLLDEATAILAPTSFPARLYTAFSDIMLLAAVFSVALFLALAVMTIINLHAGSGFLPRIH